MREKILFITRNYPPMVGGLETYSYHLIREFKKEHTVYKITLGRSKIHLIWFVPFSLFRSLYLVKKHGIQFIHLCDGVLSPVGILIKFISRRPVSVSVHGLDITYPLLFYQILIPRCLSLMDSVICVSRATLKECIRRRIPRHKCKIIPNGIDPELFKVSQSDNNNEKLLETILPVEAKGKKLLLSVGRLVERKGIGWFVEKVMPELKANFSFLVVGVGAEMPAIQSIIRVKGLTSCVFLLGRVSNRTRKQLYHTADIFVMPNIELDIDVEGFGIAAIEAGSCGLPVVASNLQGLRDAVLDGRTGYLVKPGESEEFIDRINSMQLDKQSIQSIVNGEFNWEAICIRYKEAIIGNLRSGSH